MPNSTPCPDVPVLQRLMLGQVPGLQGERLVRHLKACSRCVAVVKSLPAEHAVVEAARIRAQAAEGPDNDRLGDLIEQLALLVPWPTARSSRETNASDGASLREGHPILTLPRECARRRPRLPRRRQLPPAYPAQPPPLETTAELPPAARTCWAVSMAVVGTVAEIGGQQRPSAIVPPGPGPWLHWFLPIDIAWPLPRGRVPPVSTQCRCQ